MTKPSNEDFFAFPVPVSPYATIPQQRGMSKRELFAGMMLAAEIQFQGMQDENPEFIKDDVKAACGYADALLEELGK